LDWILVQLPVQHMQRLNGILLTCTVSAAIAARTRLINMMTPEVLYHNLAYQFANIAKLFDRLAYMEDEDDSEAA